MRLQTFGELKLEGTKLTRPTPLLLLTYLSIEGKKPRRYLADLFYGHTKNKFDSLTQAFKQLKKHVDPDLITIDRSNAQASVPSDVNDFLNALDKQDYEAAIEHYQGSFLADLTIDLEPELEEWVYGTREYLAARAREALLQVAENCTHSLSEAASYAERAYTLGEELGLALEPDQFQRLYTVLARVKNPKANQLLQEAQELAIELSEPTIESESNLSDKPERISHNLPSAKTSFIGRKQELTEVAQQISRPDCRLLTFHGMGGIGKSRLAVEAAFAQLENDLFKDGIYFVALDALTSADLIPLAITEVLNIELQGLDDTLKQVQDFIGKKQMLLVLDNYEHLMEDAVLPADLLEACPSLKLFVTSREVLNLEEEWVKNLEGLRYPTDAEMSLEEAQKFDAIELFVQRAKRTKLEFSLSENNLPSLIGVCQLVEGAPLALELAATWIRTMMLEDIASEIKGNLSFLKNQRRNSKERHESIRVVFEHSWKLLSPKEQEVFKKLAVFVGSFSREIAAEVVEATLPVLSNLVNKSLLRVMPNGRYDRHFLILEFAQEKLMSSSNLLTQLEHIHTFFYCKYLSTRSKSILGSQQHHILMELENEADNIYKALPNLFNLEDVEQILLALNTFTEFLCIKRRATEGLAIYLATLDVLEKNDDKNNLAHLTLKKCTAWLYESISELEKGRRLIEDCLPELINTGHSGEIAWASKILGNIHLAQGNFGQAKKAYSDELEIHRKEDNYLEMSATLNNIGFLNIIEGNYEEAETHILESIEIDRRFERLSPLASELDSLGTLYLEIKKPRDAENAFQESLNIAEEIGFLWQVPMALTGIAKALHMQGKSTLAKTNLNEALKNAKLTNNDIALVSIHTSVAKILINDNEFDAAEEHLFEALTLAQDLKLESETCTSLLEVAKLAIKLRDFRFADRLISYVEYSPAAWHSIKKEAQTIKGYKVKRSVSKQPQRENSSSLNRLERQVSHFV